MSAFKAYDIRGVYNRDFDKETVYRIGFFLPKLLNADRVMVGFDARASTPEIFEALCRGINDQGAPLCPSDSRRPPWSTSPRPEGQPADARGIPPEEGAPGVP